MPRLPRLLAFAFACSASFACDPGSDNPASAPLAGPGGPGSPGGGGAASVVSWEGPATDDTWTRSSEETPVGTHGQLSVVGTNLVDQNGEPVQLKGVSSLWLNWENAGFAENEAAVLWMRDNWNISLIRAAMGVEPDGAYLANKDKAKAQVDRVVTSAVAAGIYVIIDWHDHNAATENQAEAVAFFSEVSAKYKDLPNVIYETFNEPLMIPWDTIKAYHEAVVPAIRANDPANVIVLGTPNWSQYVDIAAQAPVAGENLMYTLHFYTCTHTGWLRTRAETALARGLPLFVTEWGATPADGGAEDRVVCEPQADEWHTWMRLHLVSWTAWKLDGCPDSSCLLRPGAPLEGGWTDEWLQGHGPYVREKLLD
jgi:endoglucanase